MNLYSINTIKQVLSFSPLIYSIRKSDYSESLILTYNDTDDNTHQEILWVNRSMLSNWMEILDYDTEDKETLGKTFDLLLSFVHPFEIQPNMQNDNLEMHIDNFMQIHRIISSHHLRSFSISDYPLWCPAKLWFGNVNYVTDIFRQNILLTRCIATAFIKILPQPTVK